MLRMEPSLCLRLVQQRKTPTSWAWCQPGCAKPCGELHGPASEKPDAGLDLHARHPRQPRIASIAETDSTSKLSSDASGLFKVVDAESATGCSHT